MKRTEYERLPRERKQQLEHESMLLVIKLHALASRDPKVVPTMRRAYARHDRRRDLRPY